MNDVALRMDGVYKRFRKGEMYDSLRDLIPALTGRVFPGRRADKREFWALQDVSFEVRKGEAFAIVGHNGAGKSTMLKILSRIMRPTCGQMVVFGRLSALIEVTAGFHPDLTGRENVFLNGTILGMSRKEIATKFDAIVDFSGLGDFIDTPVKRYSSGMLARLGFAVAAHVDPEVLIVDEVLSVGDVLFQQRCIARMTEIIGGGATVVFVSHNLRAVADLCQRAMLLDHGKVGLIGDTGRVISQYVESMRGGHAGNSLKAAHLKRVVLRRGNDECVQFAPGERCYVDVEAIAKNACARLCVAIHITDENRYYVFSTSTITLAQSSLDLRSGDRLRCTFELRLNMAYGKFDMQVALFQHDPDVTIDEWSPAASFFVGSSSTGGRGIVDCKPVLLSQVVDPE